MSQDPSTGHSDQPQHADQHEMPNNLYAVPLDPNDIPAPYGYRQQEQHRDYSAPPQAAPLPLEQAIKELPGQYAKVLMNPSVETFTQEMGKARWNIFWVQLLGYALISAILSYITSLIMLNPFQPTDPTINPIVFLLVRWGLTLGLTPLIVGGFFAGNGIRYLIAKAFLGQGTFLAQGYTDLLLSVPLGILSVLVSRIPLFGILGAFGIVVYGTVLRIFSVMAVHRLSGGKATAVVLLPIAIVILLIVLFVMMIIGMAIIAGLMIR
jgi:hypothetical protein